MRLCDQTEKIKDPSQKTPQAITSFTSNFSTPYSLVLAVIPMVCFPLDKPPGFFTVMTTSLPTLNFRGFSLEILLMSTFSPLIDASRLLWLTFSPSMLISNGAIKAPVARTFLI